MIIVSPNINSLEMLNISDEEYFSKYSDFISNSRLSLINPDQGGSVEKYLAREKLSSASLLLGSAVHAEVLQPGEFEIVGGIHRPTAKLGLMADDLFINSADRSNLTDEEIIAASDRVNYYKGKMNALKMQVVRDACKEYFPLREERGEETKPTMYLDDTTYMKYNRCKKSIEDNRDIQNLLNPVAILDGPLVYNEAAFIICFDAVNTETGEIIELPFKAKLDHFSIADGEATLNDLKTTGHLLKDFPDSYEKYHYYRQMAVYSWLLKLYIAKESLDVTSLKANMMVVSTAPEYDSRVFPVKTSDITRGFAEFKYLMRKVAEIYV